MRDEQRTSGCPTISDARRRLCRGHAWTQAIVLTAASLLLCKPGVAQDSVAESNAEEAAREAFARGRIEFERGQFEQALSSFRDSVAQFSSPNTQVMVAKTLEQLGRFDDATLAYETAIALAAQHTPPEKYARARESSQSALQALWTKTGRVRVVLEAGAVPKRIRIGSRDLDLANLERAWPVLPGTVSVVVEFVGPATATYVVQVAAGAEKHVQIKSQEQPQPLAQSVDRFANTEREPDRQENPEPLATNTASLETAGWVSIGIAGAGALAFGLFYGLAADEYDTYEASCVAVACGDEQRRDLIEPGQTYNTVANIGLVTGAVGAAAAIVFFLLGDSNEEPPTTAFGVTDDRVNLRWTF